RRRRLGAQNRRRRTAGRGVSRGRAGTATGRGADAETGSRPERTEALASPHLFPCHAAGASRAAATLRLEIAIEFVATFAFSALAGRHERGEIVGQTSGERGAGAAIGGEQAVRG